MRTTKIALDNLTQPCYSHPSILMTATTTKSGKPAKSKSRGPNRGGYRPYPPVDNCSPAEWSWRTKSPVYRRKVKRSVEAVNAYLALVKGNFRGVTGGQRDFCHFMLDELKDDRTRRNQRGGEKVADVVGAPDAVPTDSVKY